ncbi:MAG: RDD family protein [Myxococcota bacterium]|jgi:uncharacterized RDD family membrane protein YckC|nr:RDD family protein [Myxococcota bacterium]
MSASPTQTVVKPRFSSAELSSVAALQSWAGEQTPYYVRARQRRGMAKTVELTSAEGLRLQLELAPLSARFGAFLVDLLLVVLLTLLVGTVAGVVALVSPGLGMSLAVLLVFLVRNFYFMFFELVGRGRTPGKRRFRLRVITRDGSPLSSEMLFVRNVTRDLEWFLPLMVLLVPDALWPSAQGWAALLSSVWLLGIAALPLFTPLRQRAGDFLANTVVVSFAERKFLHDELCMGTKMRLDKGREVCVFTREQLEVYGIFELQVLEDVLIESHAPGANQQLMQRVASRIKTKIGWPREQWEVNTWQFLHDFYAASRAHHEHRASLGQRQELKRPGLLR